MESLTVASAPFLYLITDGGALRGQNRLVSTLAEILQEYSQYIAAIHFREGFGEIDNIDKCLAETKNLCLKKNIPLVLHAPLDFALEVAAPAVQLNSTSASKDNIEAVRAAGMSFGFSAHSLDEVGLADALGATHVFLSPIFKPISKPNDRRKCLGVAQLQQACLSSKSRVVALGGVTSGNAASCRKAGAAGVAVIGEVFECDNPVDSVGKLVDAWTK